VVIRNKGHAREKNVGPLLGPRGRALRRFLLKLCATGVPVVGAAGTNP
jgi:hypothetical protein